MSLAELADIVKIGQDLESDQEKANAFIAEEGPAEGNLLSDTRAGGEKMTEYKDMLQKQRDYFRTGETKNVAFRLRQLQRMEAWINENEEDIMEALKQDLHKSPFEAYATEIGIVKEEIRYTLKHLRRWARPKRVPTPVTQFPSRSCIYPEPYGVVLIMSPLELSLPAHHRPPRGRHLRGKLCGGKAIRLLCRHLGSHRADAPGAVPGEVCQCDRGREERERGSFK